MINSRIRNLVLTALLAALSGILMSLEISLPLMPVFYKLDFTDVPSLIALFTMGPYSALGVEVVKILIKLATVGTNTMYVGELANLISAVIFILPLWFLYQRSPKTKKALLSVLIISLIIRVILACCVNMFITLPMYADAAHLPLINIIKMVASVNPFIKNLPTFIVLATVPFNIIKIALNYLLGVLLLERLTKVPPSFKQQNPFKGEINHD